MSEQIPVNLKYKNQSTQINDHLLPTTRSDLVEELPEKQFISARQKAKIDEKQDRLGYTPINKAGDTMNGPLVLSSDKITTAKQAATKEYVDNKIAEILNGSPEALDTLYELAQAINNDPEFAVTMSNMIGTKVDKTDTVSAATPNKILYLNADGELGTNAITASKLKQAFRLSLAGDIESENVMIDGSSNVTAEIEIPQLSIDEVTEIFNTAH